MIIVRYLSLIVFSPHALRSKSPAPPYCFQKSCLVRELPKIKGSFKIPFIFGKLGIEYVRIRGAKEVEQISDWYLSGTKLCLRKIFWMIYCRKSRNIKYQLCYLDKSFGRKTHNSSSRTCCWVINIWSKLLSNFSPIGKKIYPFFSALWVNKI